MIFDPLWQWGFSVIFVALIAFYTYRFLSSIGSFALVSHFFHTIMSVAMLTMVWPWWSVVPAYWQLTFFAVGILWYLILVVLLWRGYLESSAVGGHGIFHQIAHAIMMAAMVWMIYAMSIGDSGLTAPSVDTSHAHHHDLPELLLLLGIGVTAGLLIAAVWFVLQILKDFSLKKHRAHITEMSANVLMSLGMAAMNMLMIFE